MNRKTLVFLDNYKRENNEDNNNSVCLQWNKYFNVLTKKKKKKPKHYS